MAWAGQTFMQSRQPMQVSLSYPMRPPEPLGHLDGVVQFQLALGGRLQGLGEAVGHVGHGEGVGDRVLAPLPEYLDHHPVDHFNPPLKDHVEGQQHHPDQGQAGDVEPVELRGLPYLEATEGRPYGRHADDL